MDAALFDRITRLAGERGSRRLIVKSLIGGVTGLIVATKTEPVRAACASNETECGGACVDLSSDREHCGQCGNLCEGGVPAPGYSSIPACIVGVCTPVCKADADYCGEACTDFFKDPSNCGGCGTVCASDAVCCTGRCVFPDSAERFCNFCGGPGGFTQGCAEDEFCDRGVCAAEETGAPERTILATATCANGKMTIDIDNQSGSALNVVYARTQEKDAEPIADVRVGDGETGSFQLDRDYAENALVVTNLGFLNPWCDAHSGIDLGPEPVTAEARDAEPPARTARMISQLEAAGAYDALYTLLHPDVRELVTAAQVDCWYRDFLAGLTTREANITKVAFGPWTWNANGVTYDAAEITYRQLYTSANISEMREGVEHLVLDDGYWRWFLGQDAAWLAALPSTCG